MLPNNPKIEKCEDPECQFAHNPMEIEFVSNEQKIKNIKTTMMKNKEKLLKCVVREPWRPAKSGLVESSK